MKLTIVYDTFSEGHAVYINGVLRGEWTEGDFEMTDLIECYSEFCRNTPVTLERIEVNSKELSLYVDPFGPDWPVRLDDILKAVA